MLLEFIHSSLLSIIVDFHDLSACLKNVVPTTFEL